MFQMIQLIMELFIQAISLMVQASMKRLERVDEAANIKDMMDHLRKASFLRLNRLLKRSKDTLK